jgi:hypothetical protein
VIARSGDSGGDGQERDRNDGNDVKRDDRRARYRKSDADRRERMEFREAAAMTSPTSRSVEDRVVDPAIWFRHLRTVGSRVEPGRPGRTRGPDWLTFASHTRVESNKLKRSS